MVAKPLCPLYKNITKPLDRARYPELRYTMLRQSKAILESVDYHKRVVDSCEGMLLQLNPQIAKEKEQAEKISKQEGKVSGMEGKFDKMMGLLQQAINK